MKIVKILTLLSLLTTPVFADDVKDLSKEEAKSIMDNVYLSFTKIIPYVYSDEKKIESLKNDNGAKNDLIKNLTDISGFFKSARHVEYFQRPGFRPSLETINKHIEDTLSSVKNNNFSFAQKRMKALTSLCISCHSQLSESASENAFGNAIKKAKKENFESDFAYGNYLFLVRRFSESESFFDQAIKNALKTHNDSELYPSLRRILSLHTKIDFNAKAAQDFILKYQKDSELPKLALEQMLTWNKSIKKWKNFNPKKVKIDR